MGILTAGISWAWGVVKIPLCSWHCSIAAASASCGEHNFTLMAAFFFSKAQLKRGCICEGWPVPLVRCLPLGSTSFNGSVTGVQSQAAFCVFVWTIHFLPAFFRLLKGISMPHPTSKYENYYFNIFLEEAAPCSPPSWTCSCWMVLCGIVLLNCTLAWYANLYWWTTEEITLETLVIRLLLICGLYYALCIPKGAREILLPSRWDIV